jgi:hypothetical protein
MVMPHSCFLVLSAYSVTGKNPEVHVSGLKNNQFPVDVSVYCGYLTGETPFAVERIFCGMRGESSSGEGGLAAVVIAKNKSGARNTIAIG